MKRGDILRALAGAPFLAPLAGLFGRAPAALQLQGEWAEGSAGIAPIAPGFVRALPDAAATAETSYQFGEVAFQFDATASPLLRASDVYEGSPDLASLIRAAGEGFNTVWQYKLGADGIRMVHSFEIAGFART